MACKVLVKGMAGGEDAEAAAHGELPPDHPMVQNLQQEARIMVRQAGIQVPTGWVGRLLNV